MAALQSPDDEDASTNEDRFARQDFHKYSYWSSATAIIAIVVAIVAVFIYWPYDDSQRKRLGRRVPDGPLFPRRQTIGATGGDGLHEVPA